jgi:hypothetical protein
MLKILLYSNLLFIIFCVALEYSLFHLLQIVKSGVPLRNCHCLANFVRIRESDQLIFYFEFQVLSSLLTTS